MRLGLYTLFNVFLYVFWFRIWVADNRDTFFNRYLAPIAQLSDKMTGFLRPVFLGATQQHIAIISFAFLIILRGMATSANSDWSIMLGFERGVDADSILGCIMFSLLSFLAFTFKIYCVAILYTRSFEQHGNHATGALLNISLPFTHIKAELRPLMLLAMGMTLVALLDIFGKSDFTYQYTNYSTECIIDWTNTPIMLNFVKVTLVTLAAWVQVLGSLARIVFFLVILSWIAAFSNSRSITNFTRDWISFLLGPLAKRPLIIGSLDLTPIVFSIVVTFAHSILLEIISNSLDKL